MQGWVTLTNSTGTTFHSANTLLVAGNPAMSGGSPVYRGRPIAPPPPPPSPGVRMVPGTETAGSELPGEPVGLAERDWLDPHTEGAGVVSALDA